MKTPKGIAFKLILMIMSGIAIIFSFVFSYNYFFSRRIIIENIEENARNLSLATVNRIDKVLQATEKIPRNLAYFLETTPDVSGGELFELLQSVVTNNAEIYGAAIAFESQAYNKNAVHFAPYVYKAAGKTEVTYIPYDYFFWDWYQIPKELNRPVWSEPYFDEGAGNIVMSTYSVPLYRRVMGEKKFIGVVTADISLAWLQKIVSSIKIGETGYGFLMSKNGTYVTHPIEKLIMNETMFSVAEAEKEPSMRAVGRDMIRGKSGFVPFNALRTGEAWLAYAPLPSNSWSLGVIFPREELVADIMRLNQTVVFIGLTGFVFLLVLIILIARSITRPLRTLSGVTEHIATGDLDWELPPIKSKDEVGKLAESFDYMKQSLKEHIRQLTETTAAKERFESELKIAHDIQMGILPKSFPPFPDRHEFDIYATIEPAKQVGGDLYDFFFMDDHHLCFTIGDVSDKGVPASLFMAITRTLLKTKAAQGLSPDVVLTRVNQDLAIDNPSLMFVTLFLGILDIRTGEIQYANGGHNPPYIVRSGGVIEELEMTGDMALGVVEDYTYRRKKTSLRENETLFMYTDGVTEAMNSEYELFTEERLVSALNEMKDVPIQNMITGIMDRIKAFSEGIPQSDDITMMRIKYYGTGQKVKKHISPQGR